MTPRQEILGFDLEERNPNFVESNIRQTKEIIKQPKITQITSESEKKKPPPKKQNMYVWSPSKFSKPNQNFHQKSEDLPRKPKN